MSSTRHRKAASPSDDEDWAGSESSEDSDGAYEQAPVVVRTVTKQRTCVQPYIRLSETEDETEEVEKSTRKTASHLAREEDGTRRDVEGDESRQKGVARRQSASSEKKISTEMEPTVEEKQWSENLYAAAILAWEDGTTSGGSEGDESDKSVHGNDRRSRQQSHWKEFNKGTIEK
ncbi:hypothetical protein N0V95_006124 [Ascochyta clinopodiicola]|nr:hypothetical protein N0V95_006124 [Ascochyta clinopodiicola]